MLNLKLKLGPSLATASLSAAAVAVASARRKEDLAALADLGRFLPCCDLSASASCFSRSSLFMASNCMYEMISKCNWGTVNRIAV